MKKSLIFILITIGALTASAQEMPNHALTPGVLRPDATAEQLCTKGFTTTKYRHTTPSMKGQVYREYGRVKDPPGTPRSKEVCCEVDHLVPLELGGADDIKNLWPQPYAPAPGAHQKDLVENCLHRLVCLGLPLAEAQHRLLTNWFAEHLREDRGRGCGESE